MLTVRLSYCGDDVEEAAASTYNKRLLWKHDKEAQTVIHVETSELSVVVSSQIPLTDKCLDAEALKNGDDVRVMDCVSGKASQQWHFEFYPS